MRHQGDTRRWVYPLDGGSEATVTFTALTPLQFPTIVMHNVEGMASTVSLPYKPQPEVQFTIYQAIRLRGENSMHYPFVPSSHPSSALHTQIEILHKTPDVVAPNGERVTVLLKTDLIQGLSPFWGDKVRATIFTAQDSFVFQMLYQNGRRGKQSTEKVCRLVLDDIRKLATATESRRWYVPYVEAKGGDCDVGMPLWTTSLVVVWVLDSAPLAT